MKEETKIFVWYDSSCYEPIYGPHMYGDVKTIGKKLCHTLDDLLKMDISESLKKRLTGAKIGSNIKIHYLHSNGNLMVKRINPEYATTLNDIDRINKENIEMEIKISENEQRRDNLIAEVFGN
jgi:hypothetical protein